MTVKRMTVVCCDLDGVIWRGEEAIPGSARAVAELRAAGLLVTFLTNNSSATLADYVSKLGRMGIDAEPDVIGTSAQAAALLLADTVPAGSRVLVCAGAGVREALTGQGFEPVDDGPADAVVVGWHREFDFERLTRAADVARRGAPFVATNLRFDLSGPRRLRARRGCTRRGGADGFGRDPRGRGQTRRADGRARPPPLGPERRGRG